MVLLFPEGPWVFLGFSWVSPGVFLGFSRDFYLLSEFPK